MKLNCILRPFAGKFTWLAIVFASVSCSEVSTDTGLTKGIIEYSISYPSIAEDNYMLDLMPKKMETSFFNGNYRNDIVAGMGLFKTSIIHKKGSSQMVHSVKMLNKKYASTLTLEQIEALNPNFKDVKINHLKETKELAGYLCKSAEVKVDGDSSWTFKLYYTDEIKMDHPNKHTPFKEIKGVLMQYEIISYNTHMLFTAQKVITIEDSIDVSLEEGYEIVSADRLKEEIEAIFATVK